MQSQLLAKHFSIAALFMFVSVMPYKIHASERQCVSSTTSPKRFVEGQRITIEVVGAGVDVVLIPGLSTPRAVWQATALAISGCYRLHLVQVRGFGDAAQINADGPVLEPLANELGTYIQEEIIAKGKRAPSLVGHSMGGLVALKIALAKPDAVSRVMAVDALPSFAVLTPELANADAKRIEKFSAEVRDEVRARFGKPQDPKAIEASVQGIALKPENRAQMRQWSAAADARVVGQVMYDNLTTDLRPELKQLAAPVTVIAAWHADMPFSETQVLAFMNRQFAGTPTLKVQTLAPSAHFVMLDQHERFVTVLLAFLAEQ